MGVTGGKFDGSLVASLGRRPVPVVLRLNLSERGVGFSKGVVNRQGSQCSSPRLGHGLASRHPHTGHLIVNVGQAGPSQGVRRVDIDGLLEMTKSLFNLLAS